MVKCESFDSQKNKLLDQEINGMYIHTQTRNRDVFLGLGTLKFFLLLIFVF